MQALIEQLDLEALARLCGAATQSEEANARDAILDVLCALWCKREEYRDAFSSSEDLARYLRVATIRHIIRQKNKDKMMIPDRWDELAQHDQTPEDLVLTMLSAQSSQAWLTEACQGLNAREARETNKIVSLIVDQPETYIQKRVSGKQAGQYVFRYSHLAERLGWSRKQLYARLEKLRQALLSQRHAKHGEEG